MLALLLELLSEGSYQVPFTRREFLKGIGLAVGGLGLSAVGYDKLVPYIHQPDNIVPGVSTWFATSCRECPAGCGMVVRNTDSHTVKCEGNSGHPINHGTLCARGQAALHGLYDPDRIKSPLRRSDSGELAPVKWRDALRNVGASLVSSKRIALISDLQMGSLSSLMRTWLSALGSDRMIVYEPIHYESVKAINSGVVPSFSIAVSDYLISFAADFLETWISPIEYAREFAAMRAVRDGRRGRFVYIGPRMSMTGANADVRIIVPPGAELEVAQAIAAELGSTNPLTTDTIARKYDIDPREIQKVAAGLRAAKAPLALPGLDYAAAHAAAMLNNVSSSTLIDTTHPHALTGIGSRADITSLISDMENGDIDVLIVHGANPVYSLPASARFAQALKRVPMVVSLSSYMDETTTQAHWVLPSNTPLESWGDYQPYPDVTNLMQPTMGPVFDTRQTGDILIQLMRNAGLNPNNVLKANSYYEFLRKRWGFPIPAGSNVNASAPQWESVVERGGQWPGASGTSSSPPQTGYNNLADLRPIAVPPDAASSPPALPRAVSSAASMEQPPAASAGEIRLHAYPHIYYYDGRGANRRWLQETPMPIIKGVWGSWAELHPSTAKRLDIDTNDVIEVSYKGTQIHIPAYVWRGVAPDTIAIAIGEGHKDYGRFASGTGVNVLPLLDVENPAVHVSNTGKGLWVTRIKGSTNQHGRHIARTVTLGEHVKRDEIDLPLPQGYGWDDFYPAHEHTRHRWAMIVDMDKCIGCGACVTACYAENNLGVVGPEGIYRRREMSWLRIDPYIDWRNTSAPVLFQPMLCQHCDEAPCEPVCPVYAAVHSDVEGVNEQIYNRCVGTRYCSNNCPYKVRRFNFFGYQWPEPLNWQLNPDVTVRSRGVMEKCTFCIQRIRQAEMVALRENRKLSDGEVTPACAQTCPTGVYVFGNLMDPNARVSQIVKNDPRAYQVLQELNTKPGVIYLKRIVEG